MLFSDILRFYSKPAVKEKLIALAKGREIAVKYKDQFGQRPDALALPGDVTQNVQRGATSFHFSVERWSNPMALRPSMDRKDVMALRNGWDLVLDVDCKVIDYSKVCAELLCDALEFHSIRNYSLKYSGGSGFHIAVPYESFPQTVNGAPIVQQFPDMARTIAAYLKEMIRPHLGERILENNNIKSICEKAHVPQSEIIVNGNFDPYQLIEIDTIAISTRHLMRMPYSFNEKTWFISAPIPKKEISSFNPKEQATPETIDLSRGYLDSFKENEARELFLQALDWDEKIKSKEEHKRSSAPEIPKEAMPKESFPPCINKVLLGLNEGRKRGLFILINFLNSNGWSYDSIEHEVFEWNKKNPVPLPTGYVKSQLSWHKRQKDVYLTPACDNPNYYKDLGICSPDRICSTIKNPVSYPLKRVKQFGPQEKSKNIKE